MRSHPSWVCGLKLNDLIHFIERIIWVTPFVGVWIETLMRSRYVGVLTVTPFVGVWIETWWNCA